MGLYLLIWGTVAASSGEQTFCADGLCCGEALKPAARSSSGAVNNKCTGDFSLCLRS